MSKTLTALGLMSGTSLDGIDVALLETDGEEVVKRGPSQTYSYDEAMQTRLRKAIHDASGMTAREDRPGALADAEAAITLRHAEAVRSFLKHHNMTASNIDIIGFHGQTVLHKPELRLTVQLGAGAALAEYLKIPVVYDMRAADMAAGGQGAPLVPIYHAALVKKRPAAIVNIGGVANVTFIGADGTLMAFDTGPGNALINDWMKANNAGEFDDKGALALTGKVSHTHLKAVLNHPYFAQRPPKSLDRNSFSTFDFSVLSLADGAATLSAFTAASIAKAAHWFPADPQSWIIAGGGRHNQAIMGELRDRLGSVATAEEAGFDGDSLEAEAWAYLAVRCKRGLPITFPETTGVSTPMTGGKFAKP